MLKGMALISILSLSAWILPLGAFIKPSQEKAACGGKRAFHMCSVIQSQGQGPATTQWTAPSPPSEHSPGVSSSDGSLWSVEDAAAFEADMPQERFLPGMAGVFRQRFSVIIDPPPEVRPLF